MAGGGRHKPRLDGLHSQYVQGWGSLTMLAVVRDAPPKFCALDHSQDTIGWWQILRNVSKRNDSYTTAVHSSQKIQGEYGEMGLQIDHTTA